MYNPKLRFKDNSNKYFKDYTPDKIGNICTIVTGNKDTQDKKEDGKYDFFVRSQTKEKIDTYSFDGEAILTAGDGVGVGKVFHYVNGKFDFHQRVYMLSDFNRVLGKYLYYYFFKNFFREAMKYNAKSSVDSVRRDMIVNMNIYLPEIAEQQKIITFLSNLDRKIQLQQEKIDLLKEQKKGFMQKIFSQELRFNNFCNKWEITKVSKVATLVNGRAYKKEELLDQGKYRVLRVGNFFTNDSWYFSDLELDSDKYANKEDLLYAWSASFGPKIWKEEKVIYHYHIWKVIPNDKKVLRDFLYHWFTFDKTRILSQKNGSTLVHITKGGLEETNIEIPCLDEQKAISDFLNILESKISLAEDKFAILNQQKQAFMQQMFI